MTIQRLNRKDVPAFRESDEQLIQSAGSRLNISKFAVENEVDDILLAIVWSTDRA
jgi:hypothetical protein